jgi:hypothetical protein
MANLGKTCGYHGSARDKLGQNIIEHQWLEK